MSESDSGRDSPLVDARPKQPTYHQPKLVDDDKNTNLHYAASAGDVNDIVDYLENESRIVDPENYLGWTPLMMACRKGYFSAVKTLISYRANATVKNRFGMNVFQIAISSGNLELVEYLLDHFLTGGISKRILERNFSTLSLAVLFRHQSIVEFLIKKRFQIDLQTPLIGISPLMFAQAIENDPAISTLLQNKVDTKLKSYLGHTAVDIATIRQQMKQININEHKNAAQKMAQASRETVDNEMQNQQLRSLLQINNKPSNTPTVLQPTYTQNQVPCIVLTPYPQQGTPMGYLQMQNPLLPATRKSSNVSPFQIPAPPNVSPITPYSLGSVEGQIFFPPSFSPSQAAYNMASPVFSSLASQSYNAGDLLNARFNSSAAMFFSPPVLNFLSPCM